MHNQLLDVRKELARQKYINQVLWRKLDALMDIQGSNTRAELAIELANYHDEIEALKAKQHRANDARTALLNASSRSSSGRSSFVCRPLPLIAAAAVVVVVAPHPSLFCLSFDDH